MTRGSGLTLVLTFGVLALLEVVATTLSGRLDGLRYSLALNLAISLELAALAFAAVTWIYLFWRRTLAFFRPVRFAEIRVTPLQPAELFPALFSGPVILAMTLAALWQTFVLTVPPLMDESYYLLHLYLRSAETMTAANLRWVQGVTLLRAPMLVLEAGALSAAYAALSACFMLPHGGALRLVVVLLALQVMILPEILFSLWVDNAAVLTATVGERHQLVCDHIVGPGMTVVLCGLVFRIALRQLRGGAFWTRLGAEVARG